VRGVGRAHRSLEGAAPHALLDVGAVVVAAGLELNDVVRRKQEGDDEDCRRLSAMLECVSACPADTHTGNELTDRVLLDALDHCGPLLERLRSPKRYGMSQYTQTFNSEKKRNAYLKLDCNSRSMAVMELKLARCRWHASCLGLAHLMFGPRCKVGTITLSKSWRSFAQGTVK